jgi:predicted dinucleotide-utilizing enzyme
MNFLSTPILAVECAPASLLEKICRPMLEAGKQVMVLSCGALLPRPDLIELAKAHGGRILVPTGALLGLDAVAAPPKAKSIRENDDAKAAGRPRRRAASCEEQYSVEGLNTAKLVFSGTAREAAAGFPANVNVAAALSLAGIGPDKTMIDIWADPAMTRNCHSIEVDSDSARFTVVDREHPVGESENRQERRAVGDCRAPQDARAAGGRDLVASDGRHAPRAENADPDRGREERFHAVQQIHRTCTGLRLACFRAGTGATKARRGFSPMVPARTRWSRCATAATTSTASAPATTPRAGTCSST